MKERPLPFQPSMVRATLAGTKTQTRRGNGLDKLPANARPYGTVFRDADGRWAQAFSWPVSKALTGGAMPRSPYGGPGDRLWVRESWRVMHEWDCFKPSLISPTAPVHYEADGNQSPHAGRLRPPMFMPRWACRILLEVTDVRVERLQAISIDDAWDEGAGDWAAENPPLAPNGCTDKFNNVVQAYEALWESINGAGSWDANPWVWAVSFKRVKP